MTVDEKGKVGYQAAISLVSYEGQIIWRSFGTMLAANAAVVTISGAILQLFSELRSAVVVIGFLGLVVCGAWWLVLLRQFSYYRYWFSWARQIEARFLKPEVQITSLGRTYGQGGSVDSDENVPNLPRFPWAARIVRVEWMMRLVILVFAALHGVVIWAAMRTVG